MYDFLVERIQKAELTKTERKIADYFLKNPEQVGMLSSSELAKKYASATRPLSGFPAPLATAVSSR